MFLQNLLLGSFLFVVVVCVYCLCFVLDSVFHIGGPPQIFGDSRLSVHIYKQILKADLTSCVCVLGFLMEGLAMWSLGRDQTILLWDSQLSQ